VDEPLSAGAPVSVDEFFHGHEDARPLYEAVRAAISEIGLAEERPTRSQISFARRVTHHLELSPVDQVDAEVTGWLCEAWQAAG